MKDLSNIYNHLYENNYGASNRFNLIEDHIKKYPGRNIIDLGCGHGEYSILLEQMGHKVTGIDIIAPHLTKCTNYIQSTEYKYPQTDIIMCLDVLEHIPTDEVPTILKAINESCNLLISTVSHANSYNKGPNGEPLHLTVKPLNWWMKRMLDVGMYVVESKEHAKFGMSSIVAGCS